MKKKVIRTATIAASLNTLLKGQLQFLNKDFDIVAVSGNDSFLQDVANREEVRVFSIPMQRKISLFQDVESLFRLYFFLKKEQPHIVHSITPKAGLLSMIAAKLAGVPLRIHTFTGLIFPSRKGFLKQVLILMDKLLCYCATHVYPEGQGVKNDLVKYRITNKPLKIIASGSIKGIDVNYFNPDLFDVDQKINIRKSLGIQESDFVFLFVGRLVFEKGIEELVTAFNNINQKESAVKLVLVGPREEELSPLSERTKSILESNKNIMEVGSKKDIRPFLAMANTFVFPSHREGFPNVLIESGAMNLYCIATNVNGANEIITKDSGIIIEVKDVVSLEEQMLAAKQKRKIINSREKIVEKFEQTKVWNAMKEEYKNLLDHVC